MDQRDLLCAPALHMAVEPAAMDAPTRVFEPLPRGLRILVVDDNHDSADMLSLSLKMMGHPVQALYDPLVVVDAACSALGSVSDAHPATTSAANVPFSSFSSAYHCSGLRRAMDHHFRCSSKNQSGSSRPSNCPARYVHSLRCDGR